MTHCCNFPNPLIRDGVSQRQRDSSALHPDTVQVDNRTLADFLVFAYQLAQQIQYYDTQNQLAENWQAFFDSSTPVLIARISKSQPQLIKSRYSQHLDAFLSNLAAPHLQPILTTWAELFTQMQQWYQSLESYTPLKAIVKGLVKTNLEEPLAQMQAFESAYRIETGQVATPEEFYANLADTFGLSLKELAPDPTPLQSSRYVARTELDRVFQVVFQNYRQIIELAPQYLTDSLQSRSDHPPHLAMFAAFLEVLKPARDDLNRMTQRHLDFFYRDVLRLPERPATPDHAHLIFELAKFQKEIQLQAKTPFKAGKDASGVELIYTLEQDTVIHKAQITSLKGLFLASQPDPSSPLPQVTGLYVSPIANSADGQGSPFPKDQVVKAWLPFGDSTRKPASLGLAIASHTLLLQEGMRVIQVEMTFGGTFPAIVETEVHKFFKVYLSGEKDWIEASILPSYETTADQGDERTQWSNSKLVLVIQLEAEVGAVVPYHAKLTPSLNTSKPLLRLELQPQVQVKGISAYDYFRAAKLKAIALQTRVNEVRNLVIQTDLAVQDPTKPFQPFGPRPKSGATFYIGSQEVFQKKLTQLDIHFTREPNARLTFDGASPNWAEYYAGYQDTPPNPGSLNIQALRKKTWIPQPPPIQRNFFATLPFSLSNSELNKLTPDAIQEPEPVETWTVQSKEGFLRLQLVGDDFLHEQYPQVLSRQVLAQAMAATTPATVILGAYYYLNGKLEKATSDNKGTISLTNPQTVIPNEPYTPVIQSLHLSYTAVATANECELFHLYPFEGTAQIKLPTSVTATTPDSEFPLLIPPFTQQGTHEGELLIGLANLNPPTGLPLLFQVAEETADTTLPRLKENAVQWYYLLDNTWKRLENHQIISDTTNGLITSGIVHLAIPADIRKTGTTILDPSLHWIKLSVPALSGTICHILGVHTQAARVTFADQGNDPKHLAAPLPAGTISKLVTPNPAIKAIAQPYNSFGGRMREQPEHYALRISESLRHKGRAITIFDYERLVLDRFPEIYKVRCINHGRINAQNQLEELSPGAVTLAVIPDLSQRKTTNDLEPKVNVNLLQEIQTYVKSLCSDWVEVYVVNPQYEPIRAQFQVRFKPLYEANFGYYQRQLDRAIVGFLSPWTVNTGAEIHFGGKVYRSSILNFVEEQPYVEHVIDFKMHQRTQQDLREIVASTAHSILVSASPTAPTGMSHIIEPITTYPPNQSLVTGELGYEPVSQIIMGEV
jgi:hypothetical protein